MGLRHWRTSFAPHSRRGSERGAGTRVKRQTRSELRRCWPPGAEEARSRPAAVRPGKDEGAKRRRLRVVLARPGCVGACTKGLSVAAAALRRRIHRAVCSGEGGRRADGPVRRCSGRPRAMCACVCCPPAPPTPRRGCVCVCAGRLLSSSGPWLCSRSASYSFTVIAELLKARGRVNVTVVTPFLTEESNLSRKGVTFPTLPYSGMMQK